MEDNLSFASITYCCLIAVPLLLAMQVGVAIASTPKDMVAAAADIIVLNGQGITNLPWLFRLADRTHVILQQVGEDLKCLSLVALQTCIWV
jgi:hypothetical protein